MYEQTVEICEKMGLYQYEVSNFAKEGQESQHNQNYWRSGEWIGLGPGAASRLHLPQRTAFSQVSLAKASFK
jgi:coproporphyrinogen III oxidase-like Fe-S oxidoreductase